MMTTPPMTTAELEDAARLIASRLGVTLAEARRITAHLEERQPGRLAALTTDEEATGHDQPASHPASHRQPAAADLMVRSLRR